MKFNLNLHGLRGLAALAVFLFHWVALIPGAAPLLQFSSGPLAFSLATPLGFGWLGVTVFFVLSGFLLAAKLQDVRLDARVVGAYLAHRGLRILPAYWVQLMVFIAIAGMGASWPAMPPARQFAANLLLWMDLPPWMERPINGVAWTLPVEMMFYLILPAVVLLVRARGAVQVLLAAVTVTFLWRYAVPFIWPAPSQADNLTILNALPGSLSVFVLGVAAAHAPRVASPRAVLAWLLGGMAGLVILCVILLDNLATYYQGGLLLTVWTTFAGAAIAAIVHGLSLATKPLPVLGTGVLRRMGDLSYGLYLWHLPVLLWLKAALPTDAGAPLMALWVLGGASLASLALAELSYRLVEVPAIRLSQRSFPLAARAA